MKNEELDALKNALRHSPSSLKNCVVEAIPIYMHGIEPDTVDNTFEWFYCHFASLESWQRYGSDVNWDGWMKKLIKQLNN